MGCQPTPKRPGMRCAWRQFLDKWAALIHITRIPRKPADAETTWNAICLADFGDTVVAFVALPQIPPRNVTWSKKGKWVHLGKIAFEKYFMRKVRTGSLTPVYETYVLKQLGIVSLKRRAN